MRYMLDTNIIVYAKNARPEIVLKRFQQYNPGELCISAITMAELEYGVCNSSKPKQNRLALLTFLSNIEVIPFDMEAAKVYGAEVTCKCGTSARGNFEYDFYRSRADDDYDYYKCKKCGRKYRVGMYTREVTEI